MRQGHDAGNLRPDGVNQLLGLRFSFTVATAASGLLVFVPWRRGSPAADRPIRPD